MTHFMLFSEMHKLYTIIIFQLFFKEVLLLFLELNCFRKYKSMFNTKGTFLFGMICEPNNEVSIA